MTNRETISQILGIEDCRHNCAAGRLGGRVFAEYVTQEDNPANEEEEFINWDDMLKAAKVANVFITFYQEVIEKKELS